MARIPGAREVERSLRDAQRRAAAALKGAYKQAAKLMERGRAADAQALATKANAVKAFQGRIGALRQEWREIQRAPGREAGERATRTPLWRLYQPILESLVEADGTTTQERLEALVAKRLDGALAEHERSSSGAPRLQSMVRRARRPMQREGWIERGAGGWRITVAGRAAAQRGVAGPPNG